MEEKLINVKELLLGDYSDYGLCYMEQGPNHGCIPTMNVWFTNVPIKDVWGDDWDDYDEISPPILDKNSVVIVNLEFDGDWCDSIGNGNLWFTLDNDGDFPGNNFSLSANSLTMRDIVVFQRLPILSYHDYKKNTCTNFFSGMSPYEFILKFNEIFNNE